MLSRTRVLPLSIPKAPRHPNQLHCCVCYSYCWTRTQSFRRERRQHRNRRCIDEGIEPRARHAYRRFAPLVTRLPYASWRAQTINQNNGYSHLKATRFTPGKLQRLCGVMNHRSAAVVQRQPAQASCIYPTCTGVHRAHPRFQPAHYTLQVAL